MAKTKVVFYSAPWCSGCTRMKPKFYDACREYGMAFEIVDVEEEDGVARSIKHVVRNVPTLVFMRGGKEIGRAKGNESYKAIAKYV